MNFWDASVTSFMLLPLLVLIVYNIIPREKSRDASIRVLTGTAAVLLLVSVIEMIRLLSLGLDFVDFTFLWDMTEKAGFFRIDLLSAVMLACISLSVLCAALTAKGSIRAEKTESFTNLTLVMMLAMNGLATVTDLFALYVFLEATAIAAFVAIALNKDHDCLEGSFKYFLMSALATAFILLGACFLLVNSGSLSFAVLQHIAQSGVFRQEVLWKLGLCLLLVGFCIKAGITPFHGWVPDAYQSAPAAVSVLLGGIVTKICGIYALIRFFGIILVGYEFINKILLVFALAAILFGAFAAMAQNNFKRILAYSSISQLGYIALGVAIGGPWGLLGAALHFLNHSIFKGTLFVNAAALEKSLGTLDIRHMGGLARQLPVTATSSILAFFSAAGLPPLSGFWSKLFIILAAWLSGCKIAAVIALLASLVTMGYFLRLQRNVFWGKRKQEFASIRETDKANKAAAVILSVLTVALGVIIPLALALFKAKGLI